MPSGAGVQWRPRLPFPYIENYLFPPHSPNRPPFMILTRRDFLRSSAAAGALGLGGARALYKAHSPAPLSILVLGGTGFIGPHMVRYAMERGHTVTLFNRGRSNTHLFPTLEKLVGDRDGDLAALEGRRWDAVIDNSGFVPRHVRDSATLLADSGHYMFVSTLSAYRDLATPGITENYPLGRMDDPTIEVVDNGSYGPLKALCEEAVQEVFAERANIVRPGYIVGPGDTTDRWTWWPVRVARGGEMLVPGMADSPIQFIDARDLGSWMVRMLEEEIGGVFNAVGPTRRLTMGAFLASCREVSGSDATFHWASEEFVAEQGLRFPIWAPHTGAFAAIHSVDASRAIATGYTSRPVHETIADTLDWWNGLTEEDRPGGAMRSGLRKPPALGGGPATLEAMMEIEEEALAAWMTRPEEVG